MKKNARKRIDSFKKKAKDNSHLIEEVVYEDMEMYDPVTKQNIIRKVKVIRYRTVSKPVDDIIRSSDILSDIEVSEALSEVLKDQDEDEE